MDYSKLSLKCKICFQEFKKNKSFTSHLKNKHKISSKNYYDSFFKKQNEGKCILCNKPTKWARKYFTYCSRSCQSKAIEKNSFKTKEKRKKTCLKKYGIEYICNSLHAKNKLKKYWDEMTKEKLKKRIKKTKNTLYFKYGVDSFSKTLQFKQKFANTMMQRYGVTRALQSKVIRDKMKKYSFTPPKKYVLPSGKHIYLQGYEPLFLDFIFKNNLLKENQIKHEPFSIEYFDINNKKKFYFPDFYIFELNLIIEIKSKYTEKLDLNVERKKQACISKGYSYIRIIDNNFLDFQKILNEKHLN